MMRRHIKPEPKQPPAWNVARWVPQRTWPPRHKVMHGDLGWMKCEACGADHQLWMSDGGTWRLVPRRLRRFIMCVPCTRLFGNRDAEGVALVMGLRPSVAAARAVAAFVCRCAANRHVPLAAPVILPGDRRDSGV